MCTKHKTPNKSHSWLAPLGSHCSARVRVRPLTRRLALHACNTGRRGGGAGALALLGSLHSARFARLALHGLLHSACFTQLTSLGSLHSARFAWLALLGSLRLARFARLALLGSRRVVIAITGFLVWGTNASLTCYLSKVIGTSLIMVGRPLIL